MDLFGRAYVWRVEKPREFTKNELAELKKQVLKTDKTAMAFHEEWKRFDTLVKTAHGKKKKAEYGKKREKARTAFYNRLTNERRKKQREIRRGELDEMMSSMTLNELRERAFNPPEGQHFATRLECLEFLIGLNNLDIFGYLSEELH